MIDTEDLRTVEVFADLSDDDLRWLADVARSITLDVGEKVVEEGAPVKDVFAILDGEIHLVRESGPPDDRWIVRSAGQVTGMLPLSRMTHSPVALRALVPTRIAAWTVAQVDAMLDRIPVLHARFAAALLDRSREFARLDEQGERLQSLGKLSAGLAHELNNPAGAVQRRVDELGRQLRELSDVALEGLGRVVPADRLATLQAEADRASAIDREGRDALERSEAQDALRSWLEAREVPDAWSVAETLESEGLSLEALEQTIDGVPSDAARSAARWLAADLAARRLLVDVAEASKRIVDLIAAVKSYSNQDRGPSKGSVDPNEGLRSTLAILKHKLQGADLVVDLDLDPELPRVAANAGELNQVWTNLIDNAIDASPDGGTLAVRSSAGPTGVHVRVTDEGSGIPPDVRPHIFEPFFTTKGVGEGSGIGLDIVHRIVRSHGGAIRVESEPGRTCFEVTLPLATPGRREDEGDA